MERYEIIKHGVFEINHEIQLDLDFVLNDFVIPKSRILEGGGGRSWISSTLQNNFKKRGWKTEHRFPGHVYKIDCIKNGVALDIEWNNKDTFYDRDLASFRALHENKLINSGIIITRASSLQGFFKNMVKYDGLSKDKFVSTTTHSDRLKMRLDNGSAGSCPILVYAIQEHVIKNENPISISDEFFIF